jgi:Na+/serine symporter
MKQYLWNYTMAPEYVSTAYFTHIPPVSLLVCVVAGQGLGIIFAAVTNTSATTEELLGPSFFYAVHAVVWNVGD